MASYIILYELIKNKILSMRYKNWQGTFISIGDDRVVIRQDIPEKHKFTSIQLKKGAQRSLTASSNIFPEIMVGIYDVFKRGDFEEAMIMQNSIYVLVRTKIFECSRVSIRSMATLTLFSLQKLSNEQS
jgi:hypothetical protein